MFTHHQRKDFKSTLDQHSEVSKSSSNTVPSIMHALRKIVCSGFDSSTSKTSKYPVRENNGCLECEQDIYLTASWKRKSPFELSQRIIKYYPLLFCEATENDSSLSSSPDDGINGTKAPGFRKQTQEEMQDELIVESTARNKYERVLLALIEDNVVNLDIDALPFGVALPIRDRRLVEVSTTSKCKLVIRSIRSYWT